jgi:hypothetical protein
MRWGCAVTARIIDIRGRMRELVAKRPLADQLRASIALQRIERRGFTSKLLAGEFDSEAQRDELKSRARARDELAGRCHLCGEHLLQGGYLDTRDWQLTCASCAQKGER